MSLKPWYILFLGLAVISAPISVHLPEEDIPQGVIGVNCRFPDFRFLPPQMRRGMV